MPVAPSAAGDMRAFYLEGEYWTIAYEGTILRLRDSKGLRYVAHLLRHPGEPIPALQLLRVAGPTSIAGVPRQPDLGDGPGDELDTERARSAVTKRIRSAVKKIHAHHAPLGRYLLATIKTGLLCAYRPDEPSSGGRW